MGPSGSGKTTLMNLLGGLDIPDEGRVLVDGLDLTRLSRPDLIRYRRERVGLVFQQFHLIPYLNAVENVMLAQYLHSMAGGRGAAPSNGSVRHRLHHLPAHLSGRRAAARLSPRPHQPAALVLADGRPSRADNERAVMELFQKMHDRGQTIVMVTHDLSVGQRADRQVQLEHGCVAGEFLTQAQDDEAIDEVLEYLWLKGEGDELAHETCVRGAQLATDRLLDRMRSRGILEPAAEPTFTEEGRRRARSLIRRQRLAEKLFSETFQMHEAQVEEEACYFEHILSPTVTDSICAFLGHPADCPHGKRIPEGECCPSRRAGSAASGRELA
jgi:putative ABC transport system ATP-binding protein